LELPAGTLEKGEEPGVCAERELMEEIGKAPGELISLGTLFPAPGFCNEIQHLFCARNLRDQKATPDEDEFITTVELSRREIEESIRSGRLNDAKSLALIFRAMIDNLF
jgi:ADP-ribose pyrophosphatase